MKMVSRRTNGFGMHKALILPLTLGCSSPLPTSELQHDVVQKGGLDEKVEHLRLQQASIPLLLPNLRVNVVLEQYVSYLDRQTTTMMQHTHNLRAISIP